MKYHEREFFIALIRSGKIFITENNLHLEIRPLTVEQSFRSCQIYQLAYEKAYSEEFMTEDDLKLWMFENQLWMPQDDKIVDKINKDIEKLKLEIYNSYGNQKLTQSIRSSLRVTESKLLSHLNKKNSYYNNTCEGIATSEKMEWIVKNTTYLNDSIYNFEDISLEVVMSEFHKNILSETQLRELARTDPWRSSWTVRANSGQNLFCNPSNTELNYNQKNLLIWSQMYDNIQESIECPCDEIIQDDDMLDGWFISQKQKREKEKLSQDVDNTSLKNDKIKNSSEIFLMSDPRDEQRLEFIDQLNDPNAKRIKAQRSAQLKNSSGSVNELHFRDQQEKMMQQARSMKSRQK